MGFGKAFLLSIVAFVGVNFIFTIIYYAIGPGFDVLFFNIQNYPLVILYYLFGSIISTPSIIFDWIIVSPILGAFLLPNLILGLGYLAAPIVAAILAGRFGESKGQCFGGWLLTAVISTVPVIIGTLLSPFTQLEISNIYGWWLPPPPSPPFEMILVFPIISCLINIIFYGLFALLISKIEYY
ncbi:MAG: hypothetical protein ACFE75_07680 [Candidatus Hodarchaeota archaeon]